MDHKVEKFDLGWENTRECKFGSIGQRHKKVHIQKRNWPECNFDEFAIQIQFQSSNLFSGE